jgi:hypothetical protein
VGVRTTPLPPSPPSPAKEEGTLTYPCQPRVGEYTGRGGRSAAKRCDIMGGFLGFMNHEITAKKRQFYRDAKGMPDTTGSTNAALRCRALTGGYARGISE